MAGEMSASATEAVIEAAIFAGAAGNVWQMADTLQFMRYCTMHVYFAIQYDAFL